MEPIRLYPFLYSWKRLINKLYFLFFQIQLVTSASVMNSSLFTTPFSSILLDTSLDWFTNARYLTQF